MYISLSSEKLDSIVEIIESNDELIEYDYKNKENQILIPKSIVQKLSTHMLKINIKESDFKEAIKLSIKRGFELSNNDIVISKNGEFFIKLYEKIHKHQVDEKDKKAGILVGIIRKEGKEEIFTPIFTVADVKRILMEKNLVNLLAEKMDKSLEDVKKQISEALEKELKIISQLRSLNVEKIAFLIGKLSARSDTILQQVALGYAEESGEEVFNIQQFKDRLKEALEILQIGAEEEEE